MKKATVTLFYPAKLHPFCHFGQQVITKRVHFAILNLLRQIYAIYDNTKNWIKFCKRKVARKRTSHKEVKTPTVIKNCWSFYPICSNKKSLGKLYCALANVLTYANPSFSAIYWLLKSSALQNQDNVSLVEFITAFNASVI